MTCSFATSSGIGFGFPIGILKRSRLGAPGRQHYFLAQSLGLAMLVLPMPGMANPQMAAAAATKQGAALRACDAPFETVLQAEGAMLNPPSASGAHALWLDGRHLRWPGHGVTGRARDGSPSASGPTRYALLHSSSGAMQLQLGAAPVGADAEVALQLAGDIPADALQRAKHLPAGVNLALPYSRGHRSQPDARALLRGQLLLAELDAEGRLIDATRVQSAGALDTHFAAAQTVADLGSTRAGRGWQFSLWAPTARSVSVCLYDGPSQPARAVLPLRQEARTGIWRGAERHASTAAAEGLYYRYRVEVYVPGRGWVANLVTDPYSRSLSADSARSMAVDWTDPGFAPPGWASDQRPNRVQHATDMVIYELHVRDFSAQDASVPAALRGKYLAFSQAQSAGLRHLAALSQAGITDIHLLPVFDIASVPEQGCVTPDVAALRAAPDSSSQQALVRSTAAKDCFNWGYDPLHYSAPEGSYATDAQDGRVRIREFRAMVAALHRAGLRVGMDVVYNHTSASGQQAQSVLDRIVPGYYHRLNAKGEVERSTCCDNTATEHGMMAKLMIDSVVGWARDHHIDSFRFDLMGHQPRDVMERLQRAVNQAAGRPVQLIGEGWNFGEVANGARFVQASQLSLAGSGIGTFSDRARDAVRGGSAGDNGTDQVLRQGYINGLFYAPNEHVQALAAGQTAREDPRESLLRSADLVRAGLAGSLRNYRLTTYRDHTTPLSGIAYGDQPAGYVSEPGEVVNYVENHDNQTLFDANVFKLPRATSPEDRARVQVLGAAIVAFSQGVAYFHAGMEGLRSKSMDRNSFDSGDWFNRLDWTFTDNFFGTGLPPEPDNGASWSLMQPLLADPSIKPRPQDIAWTRDAFMDLLRIRASTPLFRLPSAQAIRQRLRFANTGSQQEPTVLAAVLDGKGLQQAGFATVAYFINVDTAPHRISVPELRGQPLVLHPVHRAPSAADQRVAREAQFDTDGGVATVPPRSAVVFVVQ